MRTKRWTKFYFHLPLPDAMRPVPMDFSPLSPTIKETHCGNPFELSPTPGTIRLVEVLEVPYGFTHGDSSLFSISPMISKYIGWPHAKRHPKWVHGDITALRMRADSEGKLASPKEDTLHWLVRGRA